MGWKKSELDEIYHSTGGDCHLCWKKLARTNYGKLRARAPWEVDHSVAQANGGSNYFRNLRPACPPCNRSKGKRRNEVIRRENGVTGLPPSREQRREDARRKKAWWVVGGVTLGVVGAIGLLAALRPSSSSSAVT